MAECLPSFIKLAVGCWETIPFNILMDYLTVYWFFAVGISPTSRKIFTCCKASIFSAEVNQFYSSIADFNSAKASAKLG
uniref:hypothetical protein n=1 Tax=Okeania sp. SIO2F4 TaxID=2607790 RepID=UPI0025F93193|nr:hypothetical protein [Okeania sp. SIO2F4]